MLRFAQRERSQRCALRLASSICACTLSFACAAGAAPEYTQTGELLIPLVATVPSGKKYRLSGTVTADGPDVIRARVGYSDTAEYRLSCQPGTYALALESWTLANARDDSEAMDAELISTNPQSVTVSIGSIAVAGFKFRVGGEIADVGVSVEDGQAGSGTGRANGLCAGACDALEYDACTCDSSDPCGWANDGECDALCSDLTTVPFNDSADCVGGGDDGGVCAGACESFIYDQCTCSPTDPCGWASDGQCDAGCFDLLNDPFDDSADCVGGDDGGGDGGICAGACDGLFYDACTCAPTDPCGWGNDGRCDADCSNFVANPFDDSTDCSDGGGDGGICAGACDGFIYDACTCGSTDPCGWTDDGQCDAECSGFGIDPFDDSVDCAGVGGGDYFCGVDFDSEWSHSSAAKTCTDWCDGRSGEAICCYSTHNSRENGRPGFFLECRNLQ